MIIPINPAVPGMTSNTRPSRRSSDESLVSAIVRIIFTGGEGSSSMANVLFASLAWLAAAIVLLTLGAIIVMLVIGSWPAIEKFGVFQFLTTSEWNPVTEQFGALSSISGTVITSVIAIAIGLPISFGIALFITQLSPPWLKRPIGTAIELLAAIPSIIYGMWGLFVFAPFFAEQVQPLLSATLGNIPLAGLLFQGLPLGISVFVAGIILAIMIVPFIASVMRDVFETVPRELREAAFGLGSTRWEVVWHVILPYTKVGVVGSVMLGLGRALGETMAVTFVIGNAHRLSLGLFNPGNSIASSIANEFTEADGKVYTSSLIALGLVLFIITFIVLALAKLMLLRMVRQQEGRPS
ncbi:Phosphate transport system permease protein PstC (TC 3.A.1.7.1) [hydrothermal vent metagenome]|uniref:Phosphate transport system permease protein PstC (TC 3.A.1.7.1) n=1 Tax=hydrothermal vent metagenome TaxID=652676 RepID=A0A3B0TJD4_9ZZZZ